MDSATFMWACQEPCSDSLSIEYGPAFARRERLAARDNRSDVRLVYCAILSAIPTVSGLSPMLRSAVNRIVGFGSGELRA